MMSKDIKCLAQGHVSVAELREIISDFFTLAALLCATSYLQTIYNYALNHFS